MSHLSKRNSNGKSTVPPLVRWEDVNWRKISNYVMKLQQRIYRAENEGKKRKVRELQRLLMKSQAALLLSIRRATQINKGKRTAGVDGYKALTPHKRAKLYNQMKEYNMSSHNPSPVKRHYISKKNKKLRPLGIPTIRDRIYQNIVKMALEPQWEAIFESSSYGFRPKRSTHDAIQDIFNKTNKGDKWIFEGDFKGCFDNLNHDFILEQVRDFPANNSIKKWLKAGCIDNEVFHETKRGTPQGGIISPLLANIALHGMEAELDIEYQKQKIRGNYYTVVKPDMQYSMVRYADDFVIVCKSKEVAESMYEKLQPYLQKRNLELAEDKTKIVHISEGFDFLGLNIRRYAQSNGKSKLLIKPSKEKIKGFRMKIKEVLKKSRGSNPRHLISLVNPIIRGWANYNKFYVSSMVFSSQDMYLWESTYRYLIKEHRRMPIPKIKQRYYKRDKTGVSNDKWVFTCPQSYTQMLKMSWFKIERYTKVYYKNSPFDSKLNEYYRQRDIKEFNSQNTFSRQKLAKKQGYLCSLCGHSLTGEEGLEVHHKLPKAHGGEDTYKNLQLVHISCHIDHHKNHPFKGNIPSIKRLKSDKEQRWINRYFRNRYELIYS